MPIAMVQLRRNWRSIAAALVATWAGVASAQLAPQTPLPGSAIPQFAQSLPLLSVQPGGTIPVEAGNQALTIRMCEFQSRILPPGTPLAEGATGETWVWGYQLGTCPATTRDTYIGPVLVNTRNATASPGAATVITWVNELGSAATTNVLAYRQSTDQTLHWADPLNHEANACHDAARLGEIPDPGTTCASNYAGPVPAVPHLHGGEVPPELDGGPDAWFTSDGAYHGHGYYTRSAGPGNQAIYAYPNTQEAAPVWFHDHTLGATRLSVFAGLAGANVIVDPNQTLPANLPGIAEAIPLVIQDRMFDTNGQLFFPADTYADVVSSPNPQHPYWVPEFVGDTIVVNGKAWPFANVEPRRHRFLIINGSNARTYELSIPNVPMWVIGNDGGYLDAPAPVPSGGLLVMPGERYELIVDFGKVKPGQDVVMHNTGRTPFPKGSPPQGSTLGRIVEFRVRCGASGCPVDTSYDPSTGAPIRAAGQKIVRLTNPATGTLAQGVTVAKTRQLTLNEVELGGQTAIDPVTGELTKYPGGPVEILVNNTSWDGRSPRTYADFTPITVNGITTFYSELPREGDTELWEIVNMTADAHPIHTHLVTFQILNRQAFNVSNYGKAYAAAFPAVEDSDTCTGGVYCPDFGPPLDYATGNPRALGGNPDIVPFLQGQPQPPGAYESGWKDTHVVPPGMVTRFVVRWAPNSLPVGTPAADLHFPFDPSGGSQHGYVWHCHIIDHEDNEMMRPDLVTLNPAAPPPASRPLVKGVAY